MLSRHVGGEIVPDGNVWVVSPAPFRETGFAWASVRPRRCGWTHRKCMNVETPTVPADYRLGY
jgi:hypothetical protein